MAFCLNMKIITNLNESIPDFLKKVQKQFWQLFHYPQYSKK